eukprot:TRINITY_DN10596_c0_g1_i1.p1 TRINITY_DN10596_c0_g1~~TRINITY_DN10596_c0_g1_i1.p1  ORF type:complete len:542 (+),score=58.73 TRINITY_DN10596_c0_g1_i1:45-1670(+)
MLEPSERWVEEDHAWIQVIPDKLLFFPGLLATATVLDCKSLCANEDGIVRGYAVPHYSKKALGRAFGPFDLEQTIRFCRGMERQLASQRMEGRPLYVTSAPRDDAAHTNALILLGAYLVMLHGWPVAALTDKLGDAAARRKLPCSWSQDAASAFMEVRHVWQGFEIAQKRGWVEAACLSDDFYASLVCSRYLAWATTYDASWVVPGSVMVCADPTTTVCDPNPSTFTELWPKDEAEHSPLSPTSPAALSSPTKTKDPWCASPNSRMKRAEGAVRSPGNLMSLDEVQRSSDSATFREDARVMRPKLSPMLHSGGPGASNDTAPGSKERLRPAPLLISNMMKGSSPKSMDLEGMEPISPGAKTELDSVATVCKDYSGQNRISARASNGSDALPFFSFLQELNVSVVVRANLLKETGMVDESYDSRRLRDLGFSHLNLPFPDYHGAVPPRDNIAKLLQGTEQLLQDGYAVCVHCKGGFGRSVLYACCVAIYQFDVPGEAMLGWARVARPGAITTAEQEKFLCSLTGRASLEAMNASKGCCCVVQ